MGIRDHRLAFAKEPLGRRPSRQRYVVMAFLCSLSFLTYFDRVCITRAQQNIQLDLHLSDPELGLVLGAFWLAYALFEIPSGWLGDRFGPRRTLSRIVLAWSLFTTLSGAATGFASLLAYRFLFGAGEAGAYPNMAKVQQTWLPTKSRARAGGLLWLLARWGGAFSPLIFGALLRTFGSSRFHALTMQIRPLRFLGHVQPWRLGFWVSGAAGFLWVSCFWLWFRDSPASKAGVNRAELELINADRGAQEFAEDRRPSRAIWKSLFSSRSLWAMAALYFFGSFGWNFFVSWMPKYLLAVHHVEFAKSEIVSGLPLFFGGISCLVGGWVSDWIVRRTGRRRLGRAICPICGCALAAIAIFCIRYSHSQKEAVVLMCICAAAYDFGQGSNWAALIEIGGRYAGMSAGFINMVGNLGNSVQGFIGAMIFTRHGYGPLFAIYAAAFLVAGAMWAMIDPRETFYEHDPLTVPTHNLVAR